jgi:MFS family permease
MHKEGCDAPLVRRLRESADAFVDVFRNRNLRRLELGWAGSIFGAWAYTVALYVYTYHHGGATAVGVMAALRWIAAGLVAPFAGVLGDRFDRRLVMISSDLVRGSVIVLAAVAVSTGAPAIVVYVLSIAITVSATPFRPAEAALTPSLSRTPEELTAANVVSSTIESLGLFGGPAVGGLLLAATSTETVFVATAACHVWSAVLVALVRPPTAVEEPEVSSVEAGIRAELLGGFRTVIRDSRLRLLVGLDGAQSFADGMLNVLIVVMSLQLLESQAAVGYLNSALGIGGVLGALLTAALVARARLATDLALGIVVWGVPIMLVAAWTSLTFALLMLGIVGIANTLIDVSATTLVQRSTPEAVVSRVFGVIGSVGLIAVALGALVAPAVIALVGSRGALLVTGVLLPVVALPSWGSLTRIDRETALPSERLELLRAIPIFSPLPEPILERLALQLEQTDFSAGTTIFNSGDEGDRFYVIDQGSVEIHVDSAKPVELGRGEFFGEIALLRDVPRTATVTAVTDTRLYALNWDAFVPAVTGYAPSRRAADAVIGTRLGPAHAGFVPA